MKIATTQGTWPDFPTGQIIIVDDNPANLKLLEEMLSQHEYQVRSFPRGRLALTASERVPPDLFLLDINMPEMDGYEVCRRLKLNPALANIPVIFLTALTDMQSKVRAFQAGAADYISKPFQFEEVHARVEAHLRLHALQRDLARRNEQLEVAVASRTRELAEANQRLILLDASKSAFLSMISHEFRTPLNGLMGVSELILAGLPPSPENDEFHEMHRQSRQRILSILDDSLLLADLDLKGTDVRASTVSLETILARAVNRTVEFSRCRGVELESAHGAKGLVVGDEELLVRAFQSLLETAVKFAAGSTTVRIQRLPLPEGHEITIETRGCTIPASALPRFFDVFGIDQAITPDGDLGLGPPVAFRILSLFGGAATVQNLRDPSGIRLSVKLIDAPEAGSFEPRPAG